MLGGYRYDKPSKKDPKPLKVTEVQVELDGCEGPELDAALELGRIGGESTAFTRDVENRGGNLCTPTYLAEQAKALAKPNAKGTSLKVTVLEEAQMQKLGMNALLGVSRGSSEPAKLIVFDYKPKGATRTLAVVGKGLTFDAGGHQHQTVRPHGRDALRHVRRGGCARPAARHPPRRPQGLRRGCAGHRGDRRL